MAIKKIKTTPKKSKKKGDSETRSSANSDGEDHEKNTMKKTDKSKQRQAQEPGGLERRLNSKKNIKRLGLSFLPKKKGRGG